MSVTARRSAKAWLSRELSAQDGGVSQGSPRSGGDPGVRDGGLLESALAAPKHHHADDARDLFALAVANAHAITRNHSFVDGNKRAAFLAAYMFLGINGIELVAAEEDVVAMVVGLSHRSVSAEAFAEWVSGTCRVRPRRKTK